MKTLLVSFLLLTPLLANASVSRIDCGKMGSSSSRLTIIVDALKESFTIKQTSPSGALPTFTAEGTAKVYELADSTVLVDLLENDNNVGVIRANRYDPEGWVSEESMIAYKDLLDINPFKSRNLFFCRIRR